MLEDNGVLEFAKNQTVPPQDAQQSIQHNKNETKARRIILEGVRDHIIPHLHGKKTTLEMWKAILDLYQGSNDVKKLALKEKLRSIWMSKVEPIIIYLSKFTHVLDELARVDDTIADSDLVSLALLGLHKSWENF